MKLHEAAGNPMSEKEMLEKYDVDTDKRDVDKMEHGNRQTPVKRADGEVAHITNHRTLLKLKRKYPQLFDTIVDVMNRRLNKLPPTFEKKIYEPTADILGQVLMYDAHIDQTATKKMSMLQRQKRILNGTKELMKKIAMFEPEKLWMINGGDYLNSDGGYKTSNGTEQQNIVGENDARKFGIDLQAEIGLLMSEYAPTFMMFLSGNHDRERMKALSSVMKYYFANNPDVDVDDNMEVIKFMRWGNTMFGYDHGDKSRNKQIAERLIAEKKGAIKYMEHFRGHLHHYKSENISGAQVTHVQNAGLESPREASKGFLHNPGLTGLVHNKKNKIATLFQGL